MVKNKYKHFNPDEHQVNTNYECPEELKGQLKLGDFFG